MIVYFDNGSWPLLRDCFKESGVRHVTPYRSFAFHLADSITCGKFCLRGYKYTNPIGPDDDTIIVFDTKVPTDYLIWLCRKYPNRRIVLWFWNPVQNARRIDLIPHKVELWSYSKHDCERFRMRHNTRFYFDSVAQRAAQEPARPWPDTPKALFIGRVKHREQAVLALKEQLERAGASVELHLMLDRAHALGSYERPMPYPETIPLLQSSDVLIDIYDDPTAGLSLRVMESIFWNKKLVTDNIQVADEPFYYPRNIYVLGSDTRDLREFLAEPPVPVSPEIRDYYLLSNWLKRFDE